VFRRIIRLCRFVGFWKAIADGIGRLATMRWSRLRDKESALSDVIRLATVQTKKGFDSRLWLPHAKAAGLSGHPQCDLSLLARTTSCGSRIRHSATTARSIAMLPVAQWVLSRFGEVDARRKHEFGELRASTSACRKYEPRDVRPWLSPPRGTFMPWGVRHFGNFRIREFFRVVQTPILVLGILLWMSSARIARNTREG
jgi:hypothetical protein